MERAVTTTLSPCGEQAILQGLQFQTSYVYAKNLSDEPGYNQTAFTGENGGQVTGSF